MGKDNTRATGLRLSGMMTLLLVLAPITSLAQSGLVEERVTENNGVYEACGEGDGLSACRDINGQTYDEEVRGPSINEESTDELAAEASHIRHESPEELEQTISDMEQGINPDDSATEGLPH
jgi:hypothetical protein